MIAPYEKFSTGGNDVIQIVVTRKCDVFDCYSLRFCLAASPARRRLQARQTRTPRLLQM